MGCRQRQILAADQRNLISFFCGGSRNFFHFIDLFDEVFVLDVDVVTLKMRLAERRKGDVPPATCVVVMLGKVIQKICKETRQPLRRRRRERVVIQMVRSGSSG